MPPETAVRLDPRSDRCHARRIGGVPASRPRAPSNADQTAGFARAARGNRRIPGGVAGEAETRRSTGHWLRFSRAITASRNKGVSAYPASVTRAMMDNFPAGGAAINQICAANGMGLKVFDLALDVPTATSRRLRPWRKGRPRRPSLSGWRPSPASIDLLCLGEMGIGNTTVAAAIYHGPLWGRAADWVGRGTGVDDRGLGAENRGGGSGGRVCTRSIFPIRLR